MKVLVTGGSGRIGFKLIKKLISADVDISSISMNNDVPLANIKKFTFDLSDKEKTNSCINAIKPNIIIHAAALTNVDVCEKDRWMAYSQNVTSTQNIIDASKEINAKIVFVSSSFVFNGRDKIFTEDSEPNPINYYGETKRLSEEIVKSSNLEYLILRTDQPYGRIEPWQKDDNVRRVLNKFSRETQLTEPEDWYNNPTYLDDFVDAAIELLNRNRRGIYNLVGPDFINRYDWALRISEIFGKDKNMVRPVNSSYFNLSAKRPISNVSNNKIQIELNRKFRNVIAGLNDIKSTIHLPN